MIPKKASHELPYDPIDDWHRDKALFSNLFDWGLHYYRYGNILLQYSSIWLIYGTNWGWLNEETTTNNCNSLYGVWWALYCAPTRPVRWNGRDYTSLWTIIILWLFKGVERFMLSLWVVGWLLNLNWSKRTRGKHPFLDEMFFEYWYNNVEKRKAINSTKNEGSYGSNQLTPCLFIPHP